MARTKFSELRKQVEARPGAAERLAAKRAETLEEIRWSCSAQRCQAGQAQAN